MATKASTVQTKLSLNAVIAVQGIDFNVIIEAGSAQEAHAELSGLLAGPSADATPTPKPRKQAAPAAATATSEQASAAAPAEATPTPTQAAPAAAAATAPTQAAQPAPEQAATATAPTATVTPSATATAGESGPTTGAVEVSQTQLLDKAKELLAMQNGETTLSEILKAHGFGRVSTVPAGDRPAVFADIANAVQGL